MGHRRDSYRRFGRWKEKAAALFVACTCRHLYADSPCSHRAVARPATAPPSWSYFSFPDFWTMCVFNSMTKGHMSNFCRTLTSSRADAMRTDGFWSTLLGSSSCFWVPSLLPTYIHFLFPIAYPVQIWVLQVTLLLWVPGDFPNLLYLRILLF